MLYFSMNSLFFWYCFFVHQNPKSVKKCWYCCRVFVSKSNKRKGKWCDIVNFSKMFGVPCFTGTNLPSKTYLYKSISTRVFTSIFLRSTLDTITAVDFLNILQGLAVSSESRGKTLFPEKENVYVVLLLICSDIQG